MKKVILVLLIASVAFLAVMWYGVYMFIKETEAPDGYEVQPPDPYTLR